MKAVVAAFNQEKALVGAFSVITNLRMDLIDGWTDVDCRVEPVQCLASRYLWVGRVQLSRPSGADVKWYLLITTWHYKIISLRFTRRWAQVTGWQDVLLLGLKYSYYSFIVISHSVMSFLPSEKSVFYSRSRNVPSCVDSRASNEGHPKVPEDFTIMEEAPIRAY